MVGGIFWKSESIHWIGGGVYVDTAGEEID